MGVSPSHTSTVCGVTTQTWAAIFFDCHSISPDNITLIAYPDGECYYAQEQTTIDIFNIIRDEVARAIKSERAKGS